MRKLVLFLMVAGCALFARAADLDGMVLEEESDSSRWYCSVAPGVMWFEKDASARTTGCGALRFGYEHNRTVALEFGGLVAPSVKSNGGRWRGVGQIYGVHADALAHLDLSYFELYGRWFDPYVSAGAGVYGSNKRAFGKDRAAFAPRLGLGAMSHLTERVSLRADAVGQCLMNRGTRFAAGFEIGLVWHFGGG